VRNRARYPERAKPEAGGGAGSGRRDPATRDREAEALRERVRSLVEPVLARHSAELVELAVKRGRTQLVRVVADREGGIDLDTCAQVSNELSRMLDADDPIMGRYTLEVTSPGLDRPLRTPADFRRALGRRVRIVLAQSQHEGTLEDVGDERVRVSTDKGSVETPLAEIANAKIVLPW
jgi:ribosome maturation factor RimP